jgi:galactokinase
MRARSGVFQPLSLVEHDPMTPSPPDHLLEQYRRIYGTLPAFAVRAPGRVDLIGAHVDYNDGYVLPAAIARDAWLAVGPATGDLSSITAADFDESVAFHTDDLEARTDAGGQPLPIWALYPAGVAWALRSAGLATPSLNAVLTSDVPIGAGVSSSAAVEVAFGMAWQHAGRWDIPRMELAKLCKRAENEYVGVACGLMDQFASVFGQREHALLLDCRTLDWEALPLPPDTALVVADTSTRRHLSEGELNERQQECMEAVRLLKPHLPQITALRDVSQKDFARFERLLPEPIRSRAQHVIDECARVLETAEALRCQDAARVGALMDESQASSRDLYASSGPELGTMWEAANAHPVCLGGRFIGAGFAGCLVFLAQAEGIEDFIESTARRYAEATGLTPDLYVAEAAQGAQVVAID